jgi:hypothetical protein
MEDRGISFDPALVDAFLDVAGKFLATARGLADDDEQRKALG